MVGATGVAGQQFLVALQDHPWFEIAALAASERSAGRPYAEAITDVRTGARRWWCDEDPPARVLGMPVELATDFDARTVDLVFSAVESDAARELEPRFARTTAVVSTASAFRYEPDVPILVPGVNPDHIRLLEHQRRRRGWAGFVVPVPNCTTMGLVVTLRPLVDAFGIERVIMTSMQGVSGAGRSPGVVALDILDNVIPFIPGEEDKVAVETGKILGRATPEGIEPAPFPVAATCTRAAVLDGHTEAVTVSTARPCTPEEAAEVLAAFRPEDDVARLPSAPGRWIVVHQDPYRPQPRLDRNAEGGMATSVGRLRRCPALDRGLAYVLVSHNTKMGAAKGAVLVAEALVAAGCV